MLVTCQVWYSIHISIPSKLPFHLVSFLFYIFRAIKLPIPLTLHHYLLPSGSEQDEVLPSGSIQEGSKNKKHLRGSTIDPSAIIVTTALRNLVSMIAEGISVA